VLDVGCGVGGPLRNIARFTGAKIIGLNNNEFQVRRGKRERGGRRREKGERGREGERERRKRGERKRRRSRQREKQRKKRKRRKRLHTHLELAGAPVISRSAYVN